MKWVIQDNLYKETAFLDLIQALENSKADYIVTNVVPFTHELNPELDFDGQIVVMGATVMISIAQERKWYPGAFYNENFVVSKWIEYWGENVLNFDSEVCMFKDVKPSYSPFFIRPLEDRKCFSGEVIDRDNFALWIKSTWQTTDGYSTLRPETMVAIAPLKAIHREWRYFVVDDEIVTGSLYKLGNRILPMPSLKDEDSEKFARQMIDIWQPHRAFVIDIAEVDTGYKIVEINCINASGFYRSNVGKIVQAIETMIC
jgi:hypothetical protein